MPPRRCLHPMRQWPSYSGTKTRRDANRGDDNPPSYSRYFSAALFDDEQYSVYREYPPFERALSPANSTFILIWQRLPARVSSIIGLLSRAWVFCATGVAILVRSMLDTQERASRPAIVAFPRQRPPPMRGALRRHTPVQVFQPTPKSFTIKGAGVSRAPVTPGST